MVVPVQEIGQAVAADQVAGAILERLAHHVRLDPGEVVRAAQRSG